MERLCRKMIAFGGFCFLDGVSGSLVAMEPRWHFELDIHGCFLCLKL